MNILKRVGGKNEFNGLPFCDNPAAGQYRRTRLEQLEEGKGDTGSAPAVHYRYRGRYQTYLISACGVDRSGANFLIFRCNPIILVDNALVLIERVAPCLRHSQHPEQLFPGLVILRR